jgi:ribonucleoside-diphosphate reductase alpha chain
VVNKPKEVAHKNGKYTSKESYNLIIYQQPELFMDLVGFIQQYKMEKLVKNSKQIQKDRNKIRHACYLGTHPVYDITVEAEEHTYWTGGLLVSNCLEASLRNQTCCNLTTFAWSPDPEEAIYRAKMAARLGVLQSDFTDFHYLNPQWQERVERDQLIGVSITGLADFGTPSAELLRACAEAVQVEAGNPDRGPARLTCMKPEGTLSLLLGTSPGVNAPLFPFALRRVTLRKSEALYKWLLENNPEAVEDSSYNEQEAFWLIPLQSKASVTGGEESWRDLLERVLLVQRAWIIPGHRRGANTHSISLTFSIEDEDWDPLREEIWKHRDQLNGITVFPKSKHTYKQLPFEQVAEAEFERREKELKEIPFSAVKEERDQTERQQEAACAGGQCLLT